MKEEPYLAPDDPEEEWNPEHSVQDEEGFPCSTLWIDVTISYNRLMIVYQYRLCSREIVYIAAVPSNIFYYSKPPGKEQ